jgi:hypothetical protein
MQLSMVARMIERAAMQPAMHRQRSSMSQDIDGLYAGQTPDCYHH